MEKRKYVKPSAVSINDIAPVSGASTCSIGPNPDLIPVCNSGSIATGNCRPTGQQAGDACWAVGNTAAGCFVGGAAG